MFRVCCCVCAAAIKSEMYMSMLEGQKRYLMYNPSAKYLKYRRIIVDWMTEVRRL
jgi:hypothetical protein